MRFSLRPTASLVATTALGFSVAVAASFAKDTARVADYGVCRGLDADWDFKDEWYNLVPYPTNVRILAEVDESTLSTTRGSLGHPGHGVEHPVTWCHYYDGGRAWLTTLGHDNAAWSDTELVGDTQFKQHVIGGIQSVIGAAPFCQK